jgi:hypothetical protein
MPLSLRAGLAAALSVVLMAACDSLGATPTAPPAARTPTLAPNNTVVVVPTTTPAVTATEPVLRVETPTPPPTATITPTPTATPPCDNDLVFLSDLTVPDGAQFLPGQPIDKQWSVRNAGNCDWGAAYRLVLTSGNAMGPRSEVALYPARAGAEAVIQIGMQAPAEPGQYTSRWQARDPDGELFGNVIFIKIEVIGLPATDTPTP